MKTLLHGIGFLCVMGVAIGADAAEPDRTLGVRAGPEEVFSKPVAQILPELQGATATNVNGRVGPELVFWGYRLGDGAAANLFGCAVVEGVDCLARAANICHDGNTRIRQTVTERGTMVKRDCQAVGAVAPGDLYPGCTNNEFKTTCWWALQSAPAIDQGKMREATCVI